MKPSIKCGKQLNQYLPSLKWAVKYSMTLSEAITNSHFSLVLEFKKNKKGIYIATQQSTTPMAVFLFISPF